MFPIAPEGRLFVLGTAWLAVISIVLGETAMGGLFAALAVVMLLIFRDLRRRPKPLARGLVAPADASVEVVDKGRDPVTGTPARRVVMAQRAFGEFNIHAPQEARLEKVQAVSITDGSGREQRWWCLAFNTDEGDAFTLGFARRTPFSLIRLPRSGGARFGRGRRLGFAGFGLRVALWVPLDADISARPGQSLLAGSDLLGALAEGRREDRTAADDETRGIKA
ncbi:MAG: phosphatidylserine decarboxylase [Thioalkalivibrionaceae bacterium]